MKKTNIPNGFPFSGQTCFLDGSTNLNDYLHGGFDNELRDSQASIVLGKLIKKYGIPHCGRNRATFMSKKFVIKFPLNDDGENNNSVEAMFFSENTAKGKLLIIAGFTCILQERLRVLNNDESSFELPQWVSNIDSKQVGYDLDGNIKAYDFADDISKLQINKYKCR